MEQIWHEFVQGFSLGFSIVMSITIKACLHKFIFLIFKEGQMDEQEMNDPENRVTLLKGNSHNTLQSSK